MESRYPGASIRQANSRDTEHARGAHRMSEVITTSPEIPEQAPEPTPVPASNGAPQRAPRFKVTVHRLDGALEEGESYVRDLVTQGVPLYNPAPADPPPCVHPLAPQYTPRLSVAHPHLTAD